MPKNPENADALTVLGQVLHETDRYEEALEVLEKAVKANPQNPEALNFYGVALKSLGRLDEAREHMLDALNRNQMMYGAYANLSDLVDFSAGPGEDLFERMDKIFKSAKNERAPFLLRFITPTPRRSTTAASTSARSITMSPGARSSGAARL